MESRKIKTILREKDSAGLAHNEINQVFKDSRGLIWIATRGGLDVYDVKTRKLKGLSDIMPDNGGIIAGIVEDANGDMWITSARQLIHLNVAKRKMEIIGLFLMYIMTRMAYRIVILISVLFGC